MKVILKIKNRCKYFIYSDLGDPTGIRTQIKRTGIFHSIH